MVRGVSALPGGVRQRESRLVPPAEHGLELRRAGLEGHCRCLASVFAERLGLRPPGVGQGLDGCSVSHARASSDHPQAAGSRRSLPLAVGISLEGIGEARIALAAAD